MKREEYHNKLIKDLELLDQSKVDIVTIMTENCEIIQITDSNIKKFIKLYYKIKINQLKREGK